MADHYHLSAAIHHVLSPDPSLAPSLHPLPPFVPPLAGVKPETALAQEAGLELGDRGGIRVDEYMRTSDPYIWAVGERGHVACNAGLEQRVHGGGFASPAEGPAANGAACAAAAALGAAQIEQQSGLCFSRFEGLPAFSGTTQRPSLCMTPSSPWICYPTGESPSNLAGPVEARYL